MTVVLLILFAIAAGRGYFTIRDRQVNAPRHRAPQPVLELLETAPGKGVRGIPALATLKSFAMVKIMPEVAGKITFLSKREGDRVTAGEVIARIEGDELATQLRVASAQSASTGQQATAAEETIRALVSQKPALIANQRYWQTEHSRNLRLHAQEAVSGAQVEGTANKLAEAEARLKSLDAQINSAKAQRAAATSQSQAATQNVELWKVRNKFAEVTTPVSGIISARLQEPGQYVNPTTVLYHLEDTRSCRLSMQIPQQFTKDLTVGQVVSLPESSGIPPGEFIVTRIFPTINQWRQQTVEAESKASLPEDLPFDRQFSVRVIIASASGVLIPADGFFAASAASAASADSAALADSAASADFNAASLADTAPPSYSCYRVNGETAWRVAFQPLLITAEGTAIARPEDFPAGTRVVRLRYLHFARWPEKLTLTTPPEKQP